MINTNDKLNLLVKLGQEIHRDNEKWNPVIAQAYRINPWFTPENCWYALESIRDNFLQPTALQDTIDTYYLDNVRGQRRVGLVLAGNIPAVGFHDILMTFLADHHSVIKYSSKDQVLIPFLIKLLQDISKETTPYFRPVERLKNYDAVIATGGNNTSRYFEYYFKDVPHIIRKSRSSIAILHGDEEDKDIVALGNDVFSYFGLGCRNVSKILVPQGYDPKILLASWEKFSDLANHNKYKNNFDYSLALYLLNKESILYNNCIILRPHSEVASRISCVHLEEYIDSQDMRQKLAQQSQEIQAIISQKEIEGLEHIAPGLAQRPGILDFADGVDTLQFLLEI